jgi:hypothetical protein
MDCLLSLPISTGTDLSVLARAHDGLESFEPGSRTTVPSQVELPLCWSGRQALALATSEPSM